MIRDADLTIHRLDAVLWLAQLSQEGILTGCVVCREGSVWGYQRDGVKAGLHPRCVETGMVRGVLVTAAPANPAPAVVDEAVEGWVWERLAPWYDH